MRYCSGCKASVRGPGQRCPLCQGELAGEETAAAFPPLQPERTRARILVFRLIVFLSLASALVCVLVNLSLPQTGWWSLFVVAGIGCLWISLAIALTKRRALLKNIAWQAFVLSGLSILWDVGTRWRGWSVNFVVPSIFIVTMLLTPLLARLLKMPSRSFFVYFGLVFGFGLIPLVFLMTGLVTIVLPSILSVVISAVSLVALMVFGWNQGKEELRRRFHL